MSGLHCLSGIFIVVEPTVADTHLRNKAADVRIGRSERSTEGTAHHRLVLIGQAEGQVIRLHFLLLKLFHAVLKLSPEDAQQPVLLPGMR